MLRLLFFTAVRVSELCGIEVTDVDLENCKIRINQGKGGKDRFVLFGKSFATALRTHIAAHPKNRWLFQTQRHGEYSTRRVQQIVKHYARTGRDQGPHRTHSVNRAVLDGDEGGFVKVHLKKGTDKILGATIVASHAGEMISEITLAMVAKLGLGTILNVIHPYPTQAEAIKRAAGEHARGRLTPTVAKIFERIMAWSR